MSINKKCLLSVIFIIFLFASAVKLKGDLQKEFVVGAYSNGALLDYNQNGEVSGVYKDILDFISAHASWKLKYVRGNWHDLLKMLENGEIDILPCIAYSKQRADKYDFSQETVFANWGEVITHQDYDIDDLSDLNNKNVCVLKKDIYYTGPRGIKNLANQLNIDCNFIEVNTNAKILNLVSDKVAHAGVLTRIYYQKHKNIPNSPLRETNIIFSPTDLRFAFTKNAPHNAYLIHTIDRHMQRLKDDPASVYYQSLIQNIGTKAPSKTFYIPVNNNEIIILLIAIILLIFIIIVFSQIKQIPYWQFIIISVSLFVFGSLFSILEGFFLPTIINIVEHFCYTNSSVFLFLWCYKYFAQGQKE